MAHAPFHPQAFPIAHGNYTSVLLATVAIPVVGKAGAMPAIVGEAMVAVVCGVGTVLVFHSVLPLIHNLNIDHRKTLRTSMTLAWVVGVVFAYVALLLLAVACCLLMLVVACLSLLAVGCCCWLAHARRWHSLTVACVAVAVCVCACAYVRVRMGLCVWAWFVCMCLCLCVCVYVPRVLRATASSPTPTPRPGPSA